MYKRFVAVYASGARITSVSADDEFEARKLIRAALDRPGRRRVLQQWEDDGRKLKEVTS